MPFCLCLELDIHEQFTFRSEKITFKNDKVYATYKNSFYIVQDKTLYEMKDRDLKEVFTNKNGIEGVVFNRNILIIFNKFELIALNEVTKRILWKKKIKGIITCTPIITSEKLFVDKNSNIIIALDVNSGKSLWKFDILTEDYSFFTNAKMLHTEKYLIYICANRKIVVLYKDSGTRIKAYNIECNSLLASVYRFMISKAFIYNELLYLLYNDGNFFIFDFILGEVLYEGGSDKCKDLLSYKNKYIFLGTNGELLLRDKITDQKIWNYLENKDKNCEVLLLMKNELLLLYDRKGILTFLDIEQGSVVYEKKIRVNIKNILVSNDEKTIWIFTTRNKIIFFNIEMIY